MNEGICPFMSKWITTICRDSSSGEYFQEVYCKKGKCALWTAAYTTEGGSECGCAFKINAMKNSDGRIAI